MRTLSAHFDGQRIVLDEPIQLKPDTKVHVIVPDECDLTNEVVNLCARLSEPVFSKIWDNPLDADYDKL